MPVNREKMIAQLVLHEGLRLVPYVDPVGKLTLGVGYNLADRGQELFEFIIKRKLGPQNDIKITKDEALKVLRYDIDRVDRSVPAAVPEYYSFDDVRQRVLVDMVFNLGLRTFLTFVGTIAALRKKDWPTAVAHLKVTVWARQVGDGPGGKFDRADRLEQMLLTGLDYSVVANEHKKNLPSTTMA